jgi:hypothetical protein
MTIYRDTLSCRVELINDFVGDVSCVDTAIEPLRIYDLTVIRMGPDYVGRIPCWALTCEAAERVVLHARREDVPSVGQVFDCVRDQAMVWDCFMMLTETMAGPEATAIQRGAMAVGDPVSL